MRRVLAGLLRRVADWLHPQCEIRVHIRPVMVGQDDFQESLQMLAAYERSRLAGRRPS